MAKSFGEPFLDHKKTQESSLIKANIDCEQVQKEWTRHFENLIDPRGKQGVLHPFISIVMIALLATIGGAKGWEDIETYGVSHETWLSEFLAVPFGIPRADTRCGELCAFLGGYSRSSHLRLLNEAFKVG